MQQPEAYIGGASELFDDKGKFKDNTTADFMTNFMIAFLEWIKINSAAAVTA